jgi:ribosome maturation factor RimP
VVSHDAVSRIWVLAEAVADDLGLEVVEIERGGGGKRQMFRLFIDKPGGVNLIDCSRMSRELGDKMEEEGTINSSHVLEVSSPGLERPLRKASDFRRFAGQRITVRLRRRDDASGQQRFSGVLKDIESDVVTIETDDGGERSFPLGGIARARLEVDWDSVFMGKGPESGSGKGDGGVSG